MCKCVSFLTHLFMDQRVALQPFCLTFDYMLCLKPTTDGTPTLEKRLNHIHSLFLLDFFNSNLIRLAFFLSHVVGVDRVSQISFLPDFHPSSTVPTGSCALRPFRSSSGVQISPEHSVWCMICYLCAERRPTRHYTGMTHCDR